MSMFSGEKNVCPACKSKLHTYIHINGNSSFYNMDIMRCVLVRMCLDCGCLYVNRDDFDKIRKEVFDL